MMEFMMLVIDTLKGLEESEKIDKAEYMKNTIDSILEISLKDSVVSLNETHRAKNKYWQYVKCMVILMYRRSYGKY